MWLRPHDSELYNSHRSAAATWQRAAISRRGSEHRTLLTERVLARVLKNPLYAGFVMYEDELHSGEHPRIIDEMTYREASRILAGGSRELRFTGLNLHVERRMRGRVREHRR